MNIREVGSMGMVLPEILLLRRHQSIKILEPPLWCVVGWSQLAAKLPPSLSLTLLCPCGTELGNRKNRSEKAHGLRHRQGDQLRVTVVGKTDLGIAAALGSGALPQVMALVGHHPQWLGQTSMCLA